MILNTRPERTLNSAAHLNSNVLINKKMGVNIELLNARGAEQCLTKCLGIASILKLADIQSIDMNENHFLFFRIVILYVVPPSM